MTRLQKLQKLITVNCIAHNVSILAGAYVGINTRHFGYNSKLFFFSALVPVRKLLRIERGGPMNGVIFLNETARQTEAVSLIHPIVWISFLLHRVRGLVLVQTWLW